MPEIYFHVRWPDGATQRCYSPSTVVEDYFTAGGEYELADFVERSRTALGIAGERVKEKFGFHCTGASDQLAQIERTAAAYTHAYAADTAAAPASALTPAPAPASAPASVAPGSVDVLKVIVESLVNADGSTR
ncbi:MSMEG_0570 family nitrogen starvation response protein [Streptomyces sp. NPDC088341]|uniref:MSMEG_0570 family nitrogen starvation response protein n=1 Tax=Streptomyces sp. NPDC088341 TaxID=3154870 RepID=UPI003433914F